jgi:hypothetical protein
MVGTGMVEIGMVETGMVEIGMVETGMRREEEKTDAHNSEEGRIVQNQTQEGFLNL